MSDFIFLQDILEGTRTIPVEMSKDGVKKTVEITYNPSSFTPELEAKINADKSDSLGESFLLLLEPLFIDWNIKLPPEKNLPDGTSIDDIPQEEKALYLASDFPPNKDNLSKMPFPILTLFIKAIMEDIVPKKPNTSR